MRKKCLGTEGMMHGIVVLFRFYEGGSEATSINYQFSIFILQFQLDRLRMKKNNFWQWRVNGEKALRHGHRSGTVHWL